MTSLSDLRSFIEANVTAILGRDDWKDELALGVTVTLPVLIVVLLVMAWVGKGKRTA